MTLDIFKQAHYTSYNKRMTLDTALTTLNAGVEVRFTKYQPASPVLHSTRHDIRCVLVRNGDVIAEGFGDWDDNRMALHNAIHDYKMKSQSKEVKLS